MRWRRCMAWLLPSGSASVITAVALFLVSSSTLEIRDTREAQRRESSVELRQLEIVH